MNRKAIVSIITILIVFTFNVIYVEDNVKGIYANDIWLSNLNEKNIKIKINDVKINNLYDNSVIVTMEVENTGRYDIELSNIDVYPYQNNTLIKYFVSSSNENINGFIGNVRPNDKKIVKIGIALNNTEDPVNLIFSNIESYKNEKVNKIINIK